MNFKQLSCRPILLLICTAVAMISLLACPSLAETRQHVTLSTSDKISPKTTPLNVEVLVIYANLKEWRRLRTALDRIQGLTVTIRAVSIDGALVLMRFEGNIVELKTLLARMGLDLNVSHHKNTLKLVGA
ncbi:hypothetical protein [Candidatus Phycosocius spiralis]|uniref:HMA domain-containing protein n=1 Tax=Candidatus Phycosocius spiralis TaxID=2815099 RepID=A0ABQ4PSL4_9PROT|nr:hypothetical protein [Candidatus Phycosocius spiralis]GIU65998.1 hypothetical protein PsB1_0152 [Candidatus Phycosocius spiralis]